MSQNRNKLIDLFIGNISNSVVHRILEKAIDDENIRSYYDKELSISIDIAKRYREKINPRDAPLHDKDIEYIKERIIRKVNAELMMRISKGYKNIDIDAVEYIVDEMLRDMKVISS